MATKPSNRGLAAVQLRDGDVYTKFHEKQREIEHTNWQSEVSQVFSVITNWFLTKGIYKEAPVILTVHIQKEPLFCKKLDHSRALLQHKLSQSMPNWVILVDEYNTEPPKFDHIHTTTINVIGTETYELEPMIDRPLSNSFLNETGTEQATVIVTMFPMASL